MVMMIMSLNDMIIIILLTLGSICSSDTLQVEQMPETIIQIKLNRVDNPNWPCNEISTLTVNYVRVISHHYVRH